MGYKFYFSKALFQVALLSPLKMKLEIAYCVGIFVSKDITTNNALIIALKCNS